MSVVDQNLQSLSNHVDNVIYDETKWTKFA